MVHLLHRMLSNERKKIRESFPDPESMLSFSIFFSERGARLKSVCFSCIKVLHVHYTCFFSFHMYSYNNSLVSLNKNNLSLISVILHHRLFFFYCYDLVWYKELDLKPYWSQVCTVGWRYKTWTPFWTRHLDPFFIPLWTTL